MITVERLPRQRGGVEFAVQVAWRYRFAYLALWQWHWMVSW